MILLYIIGIIGAIYVLLNFAYVALLLITVPFRVAWWLLTHPKVILWTVIIWIIGHFITGIAHARIGDTPDQCAQRYGPKTNTGRYFIESQFAHLDSSSLYNAQGFEIQVFYAQPGETRDGHSIEGRSKEEWFHLGEVFTDDQIRPLLDANLGTNNYKKAVSGTFADRSCLVWQTPDGSRRAYLVDHQGPGQALIVRWVDVPKPTGF